jgi:hypothetical protein
VVSHISRKTSEIWGTQNSLEEENLQTFLASKQACFPGRVPLVRLSVHGPKKTGRSPFERFCYAGEHILIQTKLSSRPERRDLRFCRTYKSAFSLISKYRFRTKEVISSG